MTRLHDSVLLDTNVLLRIVSGSPKVFGASAQRILDRADVVYMSPVSIFEIRVKVMLGKLKIKQDLITAIEQIGLVELPLNSNHADAVERFPSLTNHDPFDRLLLAQAASENLVFLTADHTLINLNLPYVINSEQ